jgi:type I restriction enzyme S subunit
LYRTRIISNSTKDDINRSYLRFYFKKVEEEISDQGRGSTFKAITQKDLKALKIPLPSLSEQKAIVAKLDRAQRLIDIDKEMLAKYDELIQSVFLEMFGDPVTNPKGWEVEKLGETCKKITDGTHHSPDTFENEEYPYITAKHVDPFKVDFFSKPSFVRREDHEKIYSRCNPEQGDVLLIKDGATTGKAAINPYDFEFSMLSSLALLKLDENQLRGNYLINVLNDERYKDLIRQKYMSGVAIKRYTLKKINQFEVPVPDVDLQKRFDEIVANIDSEKQETLESSKKSAELFSSLVQGVFN